MLSEMATALSSLQAAVDIGKAMISPRGAASLQTKAIDFQSAIIHERREGQANAVGAAMADCPYPFDLNMTVAQAKREVGRLRMPHGNGSQSRDVSAPCYAQ